MSQAKDRNFRSVASHNHEAQTDREKRDRRIVCTLSAFIGPSISIKGLKKCGFIQRDINTRSFHLAFQRVTSFCNIYVTRKKERRERERENRTKNEKQKR